MRDILPWDGENLEFYEYIVPKNKKTSTKIVGWFCAVALLYLGIKSRYRISVIFAVLLALALVMKKYVAVTDRGLEIYHNMFITRNYELLPWEDISHITYQNDYKYNEAIILYFTRGDRSKKLYFKKKELEKILNLAKKHNKKIRIHDGADFKNYVKNKKFK